MIQNQLKTAILLALLTALLLWVGSFWGASGLVFAGVFVVLMNVGSYWFSDRVVLMMYRAKPVTEHGAPKLYKIVRNVAQQANIPMPKVYIIPTETSNAFAVGRNYKHSAVACTRGILDLLSEDELRGVIAHEISHIKNRDTLISTIAGTIAGVIAYVAMMARWGAIFGGFGRDRDSGNMMELLILAIITPILAMIIQLAISRSREYLADESAAKILHNPFGLASALEKLSTDVRRHPLRFGNQSTAHLFIVNPFKGSGILNLLSTHPPFEARVKRLKSMSF